MIPFLYQRIAKGLENKFYPRQKITVGEFRQTLGQTANVNKKQWLKVAKELQDFGVVKYRNKFVNLKWN